VSKTAFVALLAAAGVSAACKQAQQEPAPSPDVPPPPPAFVPGPLAALAVDELRLALEAPDNVQSTVADGTLTLSAGGFPDVTIRVESTTVAMGIGGGGGCARGECRYEYVAPCRRIVCEAKSVGEYTSVVPAICGSIRSTFRPATDPTARALSTSGMQVNCDERQLANSQSLDPKIAELGPMVDECWREHGADNKAWRTGEVNLRLERAITDDGKASYGLLVIVSGLEGNTAELQACFEAATTPLRGHLPAIGNAICVFGWDHRFLLDRTPTCDREAEPESSDDDAGTDADAADARPEARRRADAETADVAPTGDEDGALDDLEPELDAVDLPPPAPPDAELADAEPGAEGPPSGSADATAEVTTTEAAATAAAPDPRASASGTGSGPTANSQQPTAPPTPAPTPTPTPTPGSTEGEAP
jgi:hypothetical protein